MSTCALFREQSKCAWVIMVKFIYFSESLYAEQAWSTCHICKYNDNSRYSVIFYSWDEMLNCYMASTHIMTDWMTKYLKTKKAKNLQTRS